MKRLFFMFVFFVLFSFFQVLGDSIFITGNNRAKLGEKDGETGLFSMYTLLKENSNLWIDAGNAIESNKFTFRDSGKNFWKLYSEMGLEVLSVCNHEIDFGIERFREFTKDIDVLSCNTDLGSPYVIKEFKNKKIGIIGITRKDLSNIVHGDMLKDIKFKDLKTSIERSVNELEGKTDFKLLILSDFFNRKDFSDELIDFFGQIRNVDYIFAFSTREYKKIQFKQRVFRNGSIFYVIPWGYTHVYKGDLKEDKLEFELIRLPEPDKDLCDIFMKNFKYKLEYKVKDPDIYVNSLFSLLRKNSKTEFVVLNPGTFNTEEEDLVDFIRYDGSLHIVRIKGKDIKRFVNHKDFYIYGVEPKNYIFGRLIEDEMYYNVLVNDFTFSQRKNINIKMIVKEKNFFESLRKFALDNFENSNTEKIFFKNMRNSSSQLSASFFKNDSYGAKQLYTQVSKLSYQEKEENRIYLRNDLDIYKKKSHINNFFEFRFTRLDNITSQKDVKLYTSVTNSISNLTVYQKIDSSLIRNSNNDIPVNYKISFGKKWDKFYAGLSYQQNFPKNGQDYNLGIQLNYTKEQLMSFSRTLKYFADIFYSNNNEKYYEIDMNIRYITPVNSKINLEVSKDYFIVYDDIIGKRAYSSEYFIGFNFKLRKNRFFYE